MEKAERRPRHDGWTEARRVLFLATLTATGDVRESCRAAGLTHQSAYRARRAWPDFAERWDMALARRMPILEQIAFDRAVRGIEEPVVGGREVVTVKRRYSDALLRFLIERDDKRHEGAAKRKPWQKPEPTIEEVREEVLRRVRVISAQQREENQIKALAFAERMRAEGKAP